MWQVVQALLNSERVTGGKLGRRRSNNG